MPSSSPTIATPTPHSLPSPPLFSTLCRRIRVPHRSPFPTAAAFLLVQPTSPLVPTLFTTTFSPGTTATPQSDSIRPSFHAATRHLLRVRPPPPAIFALTFSRLASPAPHRSPPPDQFVRRPTLPIHRSPTVFFHRRSPALLAADPLPRLPPSMPPRCFPHLNHRWSSLHLYSTFLPRLSTTDVSFSDGAVSACLLPAYPVCEATARDNPNSGRDPS